MICNHCGKELPEGSVVCCFCGESVAQTTVQAPVEAPPNKPKWWLIVLAAIAGLALVLVLAGAVLKGIGIDPIRLITPKKNDIYCRENFTVSDEKAAKAKDEVVATIGDKQLTNGELQIYYWETVYDFANQNYYYLSAYGLDVTQPLDQQKYPLEENKTWQQFFLEKALGTWQRYTTLQILAEEDNFQLDAQMQSFLDGLPETAASNAEKYGYGSVEEWLESDCGAGVSVQGYYNYVSAYYMGTFYMTSRYDEMQPTDEEVEAYFLENEEVFAQSGLNREDKCYNVRHILIEVGTTQGEDGKSVSTEADWEACRQKAQDLLDQWAAGEATEESFAQLAKEHSADGGSSSNGGLYEDLTKSTNFVQEFKDWYMDENNVPGSTGLVKSVYGYHIMYQSSVRPAWQGLAAEELLADRISQVIDAGMLAHPMEVSYKKIRLGHKDLV